MTPDPRSIWQIVYECVKSNNGHATVKEIEDYLTARGRNAVNARPDAVNLSVNANSRVHYAGGATPHRSDSGNRYDLLFQSSGNSFELYDPAEHGIWEVYARQDGTRAVRLIHEPNSSTGASRGKTYMADQALAVEEPTSLGVTQFRLESHLRDYLAQNLSIINGLGTTLALYKEGDQVLGVEYQTDVGRIDILAVGENKAFYILELKLSKGADAAVGQLLRYMAAIRSSLAQGNPVYGVIVASEITHGLRYAVSEVRERVFLLQYELQVSLRPVETIPRGPSERSMGPS